MDFGGRVLPPRVAWQRLRHMQQVVTQQPRVAYAAHWLPLYDQLELTRELLALNDWPAFEELEVLPPNVVGFRPRRHP